MSDDGQEEWEVRNGESPNEEHSAPVSPVEYDEETASSPREPAAEDNDMNPVSPDEDIYREAEDDSRLNSQQQVKGSVTPEYGRESLANEDSGDVSKNQGENQEPSSRTNDDRSPPPRKLQLDSSDSDSELELNIKKRRVLDSDDEELPTSEVTPRKGFRANTSDEDSDAEGRNNRRNKLLGSDDSDDSDNERKGEGQSDLIANIFGDDSDSDEEGEQKEKVEDEEEQDEGIEKFDEDEQAQIKGVSKAKPLEGPSEEWDFDTIMKMKKAERRGNTRRKRRGDGIDIINDDDGKISAMVEAMKKATSEDRAANQARQPAIKKRKMLPLVKQMLLRADMYEAMIENGMMSAVSDWLAPLPDKSLPALEIRTELLKILQDFSRLDQIALKQSGIGKAVMMLYKHPKETKENKELASKLIRAWSRPIFSLETDFRSVTREERETRDQLRMPEIKRQRLSTEAGSSKKEEEAILRPGDPGYINRARVPRISTKDYVVRPKHSVEMEFKGERKGRAYERLNRAQRDFNERTKSTKIRRAVQVSLEGRNLAI